jgi:hypothetical protein
MRSRIVEVTWRHAVVGLFVVCAIVVGCGETGPERGRVHGSVTFGDQPLPKGRIRFFALGEGIGTDGEIVDGKYDIRVEKGLATGKYRVEISAETPTGKKVRDMDAGPGDMKDEVIESIPPAYNRNSTLQIDYDPAADKPYDFALAK